MPRTTFTPTNQIVAETQAKVKAAIMENLSGENQNRLRKLKVSAPVVSAQKEIIRLKRNARRVADADAALQRVCDWDDALTTFLQGLRDIKTKQKRVPYQTAVLALFDETIDAVSGLS